MQSQEFQDQEMQNQETLSQEMQSQVMTQEMCSPGAPNQEASQEKSCLSTNLHYSPSL